MTKATENNQNEKSVQFLKVGRVKDAHGLRGDLFIRLFAKKADYLENLQEFRLVKKDSSENVQDVQTFQLDHVRPLRDGIVVTTDELSDRTAAEALIGYEFEIPKNILKEDDDGRIFLIEMLDFQVIDQKLGDIGVIKKFDYNGAQDLLVVEGKFGEVWVPFVPAFIQEFNRAEKILKVDLPEGLVEINVQAK